MAAPLPHLNLNTTLGTLTIAIILSMTLYGATCAQMIYYHNHYTRHDRGFVRGLVFIMWMLDTVVSISDICFLWYYVITCHADPSRIGLIPRIYELEYASVGTTIWIVQFFYIYGIFRLLQGRPNKVRLAITVPSAVLALLSLCKSSRRHASVIVDDCVLSFHLR
ncbi:uncharacterized protein B0H18DRAFT_647916 [Fomitopsis serialis]|uniref:uncharacterized protein n=1 Tax=Fomitopsis serialis TaxID=139415 RepID=UPI002008D4F6|nr:uncharacterized protein B0H18DRAFT_647916 [Neoantrodia serialis]KAH9933505.1 hypothetical protein B0H18DRAFT_647916 [Neoantrodia serialis]